MHAAGGTTQRDGVVGAHRDDDGRRRLAAGRGVEVADQRRRAAPGRPHPHVGLLGRPHGGHVEHHGRRLGRCAELGAAHAQGPHLTGRQRRGRLAGVEQPPRRAALVGRAAPADGVVAGQVGQQVHRPGGVAQPDRPVRSDGDVDEVGHRRATPEVEAAHRRHRVAGHRLRVGAYVRRARRRGRRHVEHDGGGIRRDARASGHHDIDDAARPDPHAGGAGVQQPGRLERDVRRLARLGLGRDGGRGGQRRQAGEGQEQGDEQSGAAALHPPKLLRKLLRTGPFRQAQALRTSLPVFSPANSCSSAWGKARTPPSTTVSRDCSLPSASQPAISPSAAP